ncbi:hypothetical protein PybrP1_000165 [[Pythium] brassicae (nom. inval.)]|nr:hypothetical protein PybrP1_000165 [[Pythium] brassicae (nom. inval.)]
MEQNASFTAVVHRPAYQADYQGKSVVVVLDNALAHHQTEECVQHCDDLVLLRLGPYSPMYNTIEGCYSSVRSTIKALLRLRVDEIRALRGAAAQTEHRMAILQRAAERALQTITPHLVRV